MFSKTRTVRIFFITVVIICCLCIMFYTRMINGVQFDNLNKLLNIEDRNEFVVKLHQQDTLISEETGYQGQAEIGVETERIKTIVAYRTRNQSMLGHLRKVDFSKCVYSRCQVEYSNVPGIKHEADAIIIQGHDIYLLPPPPRRDKDQVFILAVRDAFPTFINAIHANKNEETRRWLDVFNWTMTFRFDSDIVYPYSFLFERQNGSVPNNVDYDKIFREKDKDVFWLVSHCHTKSKREDYVKELSSVITVDIYGGCGKKFSCPKHSGSKQNQDCLTEVAKRYKFILAFENTIYLDYVTEKVFNRFNLDVIAVGRGGTNYSQRFPRETVIDAADFKSATELGHFLKKLGSDKNRYTAYLKQKARYYNVGHMTTAHVAYCNLCEYLHTLDAHRNMYTNAAKWWAQGWKNGPRKQIKTLGQLEQFLALKPLRGARVYFFI